MKYCNYIIGKSWKDEALGSEVTLLLLKHVSSTPQDAAYYHADYHNDLGIDPLANESRLVIVASAEEYPHAALISVNPNAWVGRPNNYQPSVSFTACWVSCHLKDPSGIGMIPQPAPKDGKISWPDTGA